MVASCYRQRIIRACQSRSPSGRMPPSDETRAYSLAVRGWLPLLLLLVTVLLRVPALINAPGIFNSDAAVVGLQALHILQGEWSWFLWGAGYQASLDALLVSLGYAITGPNGATMMAVPLLGHLLLTWFTFDVLCKRAGPWLAFGATLVVVIGSVGTKTVEFAPPRQWAITSVIAGIWLLDGASESR